MKNAGKTCSVQRCDAPASRKTMCQVHYRRLQRHGDVAHDMNTFDTSLVPRDQAACPRCGASLARKRRNAVYCSDLCRFRSNISHPDRAVRLDPRRARNCGREYTVTVRDWNRLLARFDHHCAYCGRSGDLQKDHIIPITRGGTHAIGNLIPACGSCNASKRDLLLTEWRRLRSLKGGEPHLFQHNRV